MGANNGEWGSAAGGLQNIFLFLLFKIFFSTFANATLFNYDIEILGEVDIVTALLFHFHFSHCLSQEPILFYFLTFPAILHS